MRVLVVTPMHNEAANVGPLAAQLEASTLQPSLWVVVDDGSTDGTAGLVRDLHMSFPVRLLTKSNDGGLIGGSAFKSWQAGLDSVRRDLEDYDAVMKLDADVELPREYLEKVVAALKADVNVGLAGGLLRRHRDREQAFHVPGPVKLYSRAGFAALADLPRVVGFDVMDEVAIKRAGLEVRVLPELGFDVRRAIGASQGLIHGRRRNGVVCRWVGYDIVYFLLHAARYVARRPYVVGGLAMLWGYVAAGAGPYAVDLRVAHAREQRRKLRAAMRRPIRWLRSAYAAPTT